MAQPANSFTALGGVQVLYDRLKPEHYGKTGIPYNFHCTQAAEDTFDALIKDLLGRTVPHFGPASAILSAGAWVSKPGQHGAGRAFDLDAIHWQHVKFVALEQPQRTTLYLAVQAMCHKYCGVVLGYDYNPDHHDHLHVDISRDVRFRTTQSVVQFVQGALITLFNHAIEVDGEWGDQTEQALAATLTTIGIANVTTVNNWKRFLDTVCDTAVARVTAEIAADALVDPHGAAIALGAALDIPAPAGQLLGAARTSRPHTGRIDLNYKPFPNWAVYPKTVAG